MKTHPRLLLLLPCLTVILYFGCLLQANAQQVVQLSGLVTTGDSITAAAGVAVFVPQTARGTHTNPSGFFSLPVLPGDSVVIAMLGYEKQYILIPKSMVSQRFTATITLKQSSIALPTVDVMPWATERDLRVAVSKVKLPKEVNQEVDLKILRSEVSKDLPLDAGGSVKLGLEQHNFQMQRRYMVPPIIKLIGIPIK